MVSAERHTIVKCPFSAEGRVIIADSQAATTAAKALFVAEEDVFTNLRPFS
jgi:hypothetical protein